jgi:hypothetical protein
MFLDHTRRRSTVGRTPLDEQSARHSDLYLTTHDTHNRQISMLITRPEESYRLCCVFVCDLETSRIGAPYIYDISNLRVKHLTTEGMWIQGEEKKLMPQLCSDSNSSQVSSLPERIHQVMCQWNACVSALGFQF